MCRASKCRGHKVRTEILSTMSRRGGLLRPRDARGQRSRPSHEEHTMAKDLTLKHHRGTPSDVTAILEKPISQEMLNRDLARLAYVAKDGTPRVVPIAITWDGTEIVMCTTTNAPKLASL